MAGAPIFPVHLFGPLFRPISSVTAALPHPTSIPPDVISWRTQWHTRCAPTCAPFFPPACCGALPPTSLLYHSPAPHAPISCPSPSYTCFGPSTPHGLHAASWPALCARSLPGCSGCRCGSPAIHVAFARSRLSLIAGALLLRPACPLLRACPPCSRIDCCWSVSCSVSLAVHACRTTTTTPL